MAFHTSATHGITEWNLVGIAASFAFWLDWPGLPCWKDTMSLLPALTLHVECKSDRISSRVSSPPRIVKAPQPSKDGLCTRCKVSTRGSMFTLPLTAIQVYECNYSPTRGRRVPWGGDDSLLRTISSAYWSSGRSLSSNPKGFSSSAPISRNPAVDMHGTLFLHYALYSMKIHMSSWAKPYIPPSRATCRRPLVALPVNEQYLEVYKSPLVQAGQHRGNLCDFASFTPQRCSRCIQTT